MKNLNGSSVLGKFCFALLSLSLLVGFYFNETSSGTGAKGDFYNTWNYVLALKINIFADPSQWTVHIPLHYIILSKLNFLIEDKYILRLFFCFASILVPLLFYLNLKIRFDFINKNILWFLSSLIFIFPSFRYSAIWANSHITALFFFLLSTLFFFKWNCKKNYKKIDQNIILQIIFLSLAVYCLQYYVLFFLYFMMIYFQKVNFKTFLTISFIVFVLSLPGFWIIYYQPQIMRVTFSSQFSNSLLINSSIMSFYLIPIFLCIASSYKQFFSFRKNHLIFTLLFSILFVYLLSISFNYDYRLGGGFLLKLSILLFDNNFLFYFSSILGFAFLILLSLENKNNFILIIILLFGFSGSVIFQKYFEPTFLFIFFLILNSKLPEEFLKNYKNLLYLYIYTFIYLTTAIVNDIFQITKNI